MSVHKKIKAKILNATKIEKEIDNKRVRMDLYFFEKKRFRIKQWPCRR